MVNNGYLIMYILPVNAIIYLIFNILKLIINLKLRPRKSISKICSLGKRSLYLRAYTGKII